IPLKPPASIAIDRLCRLETKNQITRAAPPAAAGEQRRGSIPEPLDNRSDIALLNYRHRQRATLRH
ncbi:MAG: hypothetical protein J3T61_11235, partial [Candidatus Brocadiales bacterium]|nr:hypothetical protein [Candidatus Bathyanammoxibius sp.]